MSLHDIRIAIADYLSGTDCGDLWENNLNDTTPGNYGVDDVEFHVDPTDIWLNPADRTFTYKNAVFAFAARLGGSSDEDGFDHKVRMTISGNGRYALGKGGRVEAHGVDINEPIDIFARQTA